MSRGIKIIFILCVFSLLVAATCMASEKVKLKEDHDDDYAQMILPSRVPTMALEDYKSIPGAIHFKPIENLYENLLVGQVNIGNNQHTFLIEREELQPGKKNEAKIFFNPVAILLKNFWEAEADRKPPGKGQKDYPQEIRLKCAIAGINPFGETKEEKIAPRSFFHIKTGSPKKGKHYEEGDAYPIPIGMGDVDRNKLYNAALGRVSTTFYVYDSPDWLQELDRDGPRIKVGVVYPYGAATYNWGFLRPSTVLRGEENGVDIMLFDDNLNNIYAEEGVDSIKVGDSCLATVGNRISLGGKIYDIETGFTRDEKRNYLNITEADVKTGKVQVAWNGGEGAELVMAQIKNGSEVYPLFRVEEDKRRGYRRKKEKKEYLGMIVPEGKYTIQGGVVKNGEKYAFFEGGKEFEVKAGETVEVPLGQPITAELNFTSKGEDRIVTCSYPIGVGGETYRWLLPRPERNYMEVKGEGKGFLEPIRKNMQLTDDGKVFLTRLFAYDPVLMVPENGPFKISVTVNPMVFEKRDVSIVRENMEVKKKKKAKPKKNKKNVVKKKPAPKRPAPKKEVKEPEPKKVEEPKNEIPEEQKTGW